MSKNKTEKTFENALSEMDGVESYYAVDKNSYIARVDVGAIEMDKQLTRHNAAKLDRESLDKSIARHNGALMPLVAYVNPDTGTLRLIKGYRRFLSLTEKKVSQVSVMILANVSTEADALQLAVELTTNRRGYGDLDKIKIFRSNLVTVADMVELTGESEKNLERYAKVASDDVMYDAVMKEMIKPTVAASLIMKCKKNATLKTALHNSIEVVCEKAIAAAKKQKAKNSRAGKKPSSTARKLAEPKNQINENWAHWRAAIDREDVTDDKFLVIEKSGNGVVILGEGGWKSKVGIDNINKNFKNWTACDFDELIENWDDLKDIFQWARDTFIEKQDVAFPDENPEVEDDDTEEAEDQTVALSHDDEDDDSDEDEE